MSLLGQQSVILLSSLLVTSAMPTELIFQVSLLSLVGGDGGWGILKLKITYLELELGLNLAIIGMDKGKPFLCPLNI